MFATVPWTVAIARSDVDNIGSFAVDSSQHQSVEDLMRLFEGFPVDKTSVQCSTARAFPTGFATTHARQIC